MFDENVEVWSLQKPFRKTNEKHHYIELFEGLDNNMGYKYVYHSN